MNSNNKWLAHLEDSIPIEAHGYKISSYALALEGWRRGLTLKYYNNKRNPLKIRYSLSYKGNEHIFAGSRGDLVTKNAIRICINKYLTKKYLKKSNVPTPEGEKFGKGTSDEKIVDYATHLGYPLVIKPVSGSGGDGVIAGIKNEEDFRTALGYVRDELENKEIIVERFFSGKDYRVYVIGNEVIAAFDRLPANVVGDGKSTIQQLIDMKIEKRQENPALYNRPIIIDQEVHNLLKEKKLSLNSIPKIDERIFLKTKNNVSSGGDSRDITDRLSENIKRIAVNATKAIPGLVQAGIDIIVDEENDTGVILEINSRPSIRNHLFPMEGIARDIPKSIIDYYFPETKDKVEKNELYYFDIQTVHDVFQKGLAQEFKIPDIPKSNDIATRFIVTGSIRKKEYEAWIERHMRRLQLNGYFKFIDKKKAAIIIAGSENSVKRFRYLIKNKKPRNIEIQNIVEKKRLKPVKIGYEVKYSNKSKKTNIEESVLKKVKATSKEQEQEIRCLKEKLKLINKKNNEILTSTSWKVTKPVRFIKNFSKKTFRSKKS